MVKKINEDEISSSGRPVLPAGHPDLYWYLPGYAVVKGELESGIVTKSGFAVGGGGSSLPGDPGEEDPTDPDRPIADIPQLSDISIESNTKYFDEIGKERAKIVLKVKNSSINKSSVAGVDARIYQPEGA